MWILKSKISKNELNRFYNEGFYIISSGRDNKLYTTRWVIREMDYRWGPRVKSYHGRTIGNDWDAAVEHAKELGKTSNVLIPEKFELGNIKRSTRKSSLEHYETDEMRFGKYAGKTFKEIVDSDKDYAIWLLAKSNLSTRAKGYITKHGLFITEDEAIDILHHNRFVPRYVAGIKKRLDRAKASSHFGDVGDEVIFENLTVKFSKSYDGRFGLYHIISMESEDGHTIVYKGGTNDWTRYALNENSPINVFAKVKDHTDWKGLKQTVIHKPKKL